MMHILKLLILVLMFSTSLNVVIGQNALTDSSQIIYRDYHYLIAPNYDLLNSSINTRTTGKILHDVFTRGIGPKIKNTTVKNITEGIWSFGTIFYTMLMGHEFGHMLRAKQIGGRFSIQKFSFPVIYGKMELLPSNSLEEIALSVSGGFEVNYLMVKSIQTDLYRHQKLYNDELCISFVNRMMFPVYFSLIAPVNPNKPETWINTMGDPAHWVKPIWERTQKGFFNTDGSVNKQLSKFYTQAALSSVLLNLVDLNFYNEFSAAFGGKSLEGKEAKFIIGNSHNGWGYGTFFNTSPLGAELNLTNYFKFNSKLFTLHTRYGFPFRNNGFGVSVYEILKNSSKLNFDVLADFWNQESYNNGFAVTVNTTYSIKNNFNFVLQTGYKTKGYLIGRTLNNGFIGHVGLQYKR